MGRFAAKFSTGRMVRLNRPLPPSSARKVRDVCRAPQRAISVGRQRPKMRCAGSLSSGRGGAFPPRPRARVGRSTLRRASPRLLPPPTGRGRPPPPPRRRHMWCAPFALRRYAARVRGLGARMCRGLGDRPHPRTPAPPRAAASAVKGASRRRGWIRRAARRRAFCTLSVLLPGCLHLSVGRRSSP